MRFIHSVVLPLLVVGAASRSNLRQRDEVNSVVNAVDSIDNVEIVESNDAAGPVCRLQIHMKDFANSPIA